MKRFTVSIVKTTRSVGRDFEVEAESLEIAVQEALKEAAYADFSDSDTDYEVVNSLDEELAVIHTKHFTIELSTDGQSGTFEHNDLGDECGGGLLFEDGELVDYDGVAVLPREVITALREHGIIVDQDFE